MLSIILPVLNEAATLEAHLQALQVLRRRGVELIGVDGGSRDNSLALLQQYCDRALHSPPGRSTQMNAGAECASGDCLLFLHADTRLPANADSLLEHTLRRADWGRFDLRLDNPRWPYRLIARLINLRSRYSCVATGDQALFFRRDFFQQLGGYAAIPLMEDIDISKRARRAGRYAPLRARVTTSARRWEQHGIIATVLLMWQLRLRYFLGQSPQQLHKRYYG
ncbi:MAG: glycosyl transferase [Gammaproteobacteria bacterium]|nr:MAG: glycosyl transferase [Gammaproteobacteria bacterium]